ncbi:MAG: class II aldolase/adducin family protein [Chloroflexi bacterium]|nr:class II aldolase/adducin family protein [Chloroflexota bacterium]
MADEELRKTLATCARILNRVGLFDIYGHISARVPGQDRFYITATLGSTTDPFSPDSLVLCDYRRKKISGNGTVPLEAVLHSALHEGREDAGCIVHVHPFYSMALAIAGIPFTPVTIQGAPLGRNIPVYKKAELLINDDHGKMLVRAMGKAKAILLRGHGVVTLGESIEEATHHTIYLEENCRYIMEVSKASGKMVPLTVTEIRERNAQIAERSKIENQWRRVFDLFEKKTR